MTPSKAEISSEEAEYRRATGALGREILPLGDAELQLSWHPDGEYVLLMSNEHGQVQSVTLSKAGLAAIANLCERHAK